MLARKPLKCILVTLKVFWFFDFVNQWYLNVAFWGNKAFLLFPLTFYLFENIVYKTMPLSWNEIKDRALKFSKKWAEESSEDAEAKSFLDDFFYVFGVSRKRVAIT